MKPYTLFSDREASGLMIFTAANFPFTCIKCVCVRERERESASEDERERERDRERESG